MRSVYGRDHGEGGRGLRIGRHGVAGHRLGQAEVQNFDSAVGSDLDVGGRQIAVDDSSLVRVFERLDDLMRDRQSLV
jgi:hypothetical protein